MTECRFHRYRRLSAQLGEPAACALIDKLQVLALTQPETLREIEAFIKRGVSAPRAGRTQVDCPQEPDTR